MVTTGLPEIDQQHKALEAAISALEDAIELCGDYNTRFAEFAELAKVHFACEERELERCGYPGAEAHRTLHKWVVADVQKAAYSPALMLKMRCRVFEHMDNHDMAWAEWLRTSVEATDLSGARHWDWWGHCLDF